MSFPCQVYFLQMTRKGRSWWAFIFVAGAIGLVLIFWLRSGRTPVEVVVAAATYGELRVPYSAEGVVRGWQASLSVPFTAQVVAVLVEEGERVQAGQPLVRFWEGDVAGAVQAASARYTAARAALEEAERAYEQARREIRVRIRQAEATLKEAEANLQLIERGARPEEIERTAQAVQAAEARSRLAERNWQRARVLYEQGAISRLEYDRAWQEYEVAHSQLREAQVTLQQLQHGARPEERAAARARVESARAALELAHSQQGNLKVLQARLQSARAAVREALAMLRQARSQQKLRTLTAPRTSWVNRCEVEPGESVAPGVPLLTLVDRNALWGEAEVAQEDAGKVHVGDTVQISAPALPGRYWQGRITRIMPAFERKPDSALRVRILRLHITMINPPPELRPDMEITVEGEGRLGDATLLVPSDAVHEEPDHSWVWVVQEGIVQKRPVRTGYFTYKYTEITEGLREGELVVVARKEGLSEGMRVRIRRQ